MIVNRCGLSEKSCNAPQKKKSPCGEYDNIGEMAAGSSVWKLLVVALVPSFLYAVGWREIFVEKTGDFLSKPSLGSDLSAQWAIANLQANNVIPWGWRRLDPELSKNRKLP